LAKEVLGGSATINDFRTISGGSETTQFLISGNYRTEEQSFQEISGTLRRILSSINHTSLDKKFKISFGKLHGTDTTSSDRFDVNSALFGTNAPALYDSNGNLNWENDTFENPLAPLKVPTVRTPMT
jgi:hypothetical protein